MLRSLVMKAQTGWSFPDNVTTSAFYIMTTPSAPLRRLRTFVLTGAATPPVPEGEHPVLAIHSHLLSVGTWLRAIFCMVIYSMTMAKTDFKSVDEYIASQPEAVQRILKRVRSTIRKAVPGGEEVISYRIPAYKLHSFASFRPTWPATTSTLSIRSTIESWGRSSASRRTNGV